MYVDEFIQHQVLVIHDAVPATNNRNTSTAQKSLSDSRKDVMHFENFIPWQE